MGRKLLFEHLSVPGIETYEVYRKKGGYKAVEKALKTMTPDEVTEEVKKSGLRGRGGAGFPTGLKWSFLAKPEGVPRHLVCNADESEPGTFKDRYLMEFLPHLLIEGLIASSYALGSKVTYIYIRGEYAWIPEILETAIAEAKAAGWLGKNILGTGYDLEIYVHTGAGAYICGEETALLESLEGKPGNPRFKPPFPANFGLFGKPTTINNTQSFASVPTIMRKGAPWFAGLGPVNSGGTVIFSVSGHVEKPGNLELPMGIPFKDLMALVGGVWKGRKLKAVIPGGSSCMVVPAEIMWNTNMDYDSLKKAGSSFGTGAVIVMDETTCMVRGLERFARFYMSESCGQCTPCREGTGWLDRMLKRIIAGGGRGDGR